jgi:hypothetical protein
VLFAHGGIGVEVRVGVAKKLTPCKATIVRTANVCSKPGTKGDVGAFVHADKKDTSQKTINMVRLRI